MTICCGRPITRRELGEIRETVELFGNLSRKELTQTICEHLNWYTPSGTNKLDACLKMLKSFEKQGYFRLPAKQKQAVRKPCTISRSPMTAPEPEISCRIDRLHPITLVQAEPGPQTHLWNEYMDRYHYIGYKKPFGYRIRYFIRSGDRYLGCLLFSGAAKAINCRDRWIGWTKDQRLQNLPWVINNTRFLIFPWVKVKNLASHVLGKVNRCIAGDWKEKWGYSPVLMETFVDPESYKGTSYLAANWTCLGMTTGKGLLRKNKKYETTPKLTFIKPISRGFRDRLCNEPGTQDLPTLDLSTCANLPQVKAGATG
ncbi:MAG: DUF4338 domain-containing protein [Desulfobacterales bacterium]|nr:DUF4338 domain-containing protein [Desulfobacterales bacterium]